MVGKSIIGTCWWSTGGVFARAGRARDERRRDLNVSPLHYHWIMDIGERNFFAHDHTIYKDKIYSLNVAKVEESANKHCQGSLTNRATLLK